MPTQEVTKPIALDETLQDTNGKLNTQNGKLDSIILKLQGIIDALGLDPSIYKPAGTKTCAELVSSLLIAGNLGNVYNITDSGTTTADFVEGAGKPINAGANVAIVDIGTGGTSVYKFDLLAGIIDLSDYVKKSSTSGLLKNDGSVDETEYATADGLEGVSDDVEAIQDKMDETTTSISGNPISISGLKSNQLAVNPIITLEPIQAGSGTPSPSNIRAISGYDTIEVLSCGKNLFDINKVLVGTVSNGVWTFSNMTSNTVAYSFRFKPNTRYTISGIQNQSVANANIRLRVHYTDDTYENVFLISTTGEQSFRMVTNTNKSVKELTTYFGASGSVSIWNFQIEEGQVSSPVYVPYNKTTDLSESLGQTVYGLTHEVRTGKAKKTRIMIDMGDIVWDYNSASNRLWFIAPAISEAKLFPETEVSSIICEAYYTDKVNTIANDTSIDCAIGISQNGRIVVRNLAYDNANDFKTAMTGIKIVYELKESAYTEIQLTPHEISLLKDYAYVSTNGTNISFDYHNGELASLADVAQVAETLEELDRPQERKTQVNITSYNSQSNRYSCPFDGYVTAFLPNNATGYVRVTVYDHNEQTMGIFHSYAISGGDTYFTVPVRKGMKVMVGNSSDISPTVTYRGMA